MDVVALDLGPMRLLFCLPSYLTGSGIFVGCRKSEMTPHAVLQRSALAGQSQLVSLQYRPIVSSLSSSCFTRNHVETFVPSSPPPRPRACLFRVCAAVLLLTADLNFFLQIYLRRSDVLSVRLQRWKRRLHVVSLEACVTSGTPVQWLGSRDEL